MRCCPDALMLNYGYNVILIWYRMVAAVGKMRSLLENWFGHIQTRDMELPTFTGVFAEYVYCTLALNRGHILATRIRGSVARLQINRCNRSSPSPRIYMLLWHTGS